MAELGTDYTGSGTELDPYIPLTCDGFIWAINQVQVYVKMTQNIDFSANVDYRSGISSRLSFQCTKLYADSTDNDGNLYGINGLRISNTIFFYNACAVGLTDQKVTVENIAFRNCVFNMTTNIQNYMYGFLNTNNSTTAPQFIFNNCAFSFLIKFNGAYPNFEGGSPQYHVERNDCSEYYMFSGSMNSSTTGVQSSIFNRTRNRCTVQFTGLNFVLGNGGNYSVGHFIQGGDNLSTTYGMSNCTFAGDVVLVQSSSNYSACDINKVNNCCFAISATRTSTTTPRFTYSSTYGVNIFDKDNIASNITLETNSNVKYLTTDQMKSQDYLISVGFLP